MTVDSVQRGETAGVSSEGCAAQLAARPLSGTNGWWIGAFLAGCAGLLAALFGRRFHELYLTWNEDPTYSHGFLVPIISVYLAWRVWQRQGRPVQGELWRGLAWLGGGCCLHLLAEIFWLPPIDLGALVAMLYGLAVLLGGRGWARGFRFPIGFLAFMFPLPVVWTERAAAWLQGVVAPLATLVLQLFLPVHRAGTVIYLPTDSFPLEVGEACSGLRQVIAFAALTALVVHVSRRSVLYKVLLCLSGPLVAVAANALRVSMMALVVRQFGPWWISGHYSIALPGFKMDVSLHDSWGILAMVLGLGLFLGVGWWLEALAPGEDSNE